MSYPPRILPVKSLPGVYADADGNIWSCRTTGRRTRLRRLRGSRRKDGYLAIGPHMAHRLVLEAFAGPCPPRLEARHLNGVRADNRPTNLAWGNRKEQAADRRRHGTARTKLNEEKARMIRVLYEGGKLSQAAIGRLFRVSQQTVSHVVRGTTWREGCGPESTEVHSLEHLKFTDEPVQGV